jgi:hypothetical protein
MTDENDVRLIVTERLLAGMALTARLYAALFTL